MDNGGIPNGYIFPNPPAIGSERWKKDYLKSCIKLKSKTEIYDFGEEGMYCTNYSGHGWSPFWVDRESIIKIPEINWDEIYAAAIKKHTE